MSRARKLRNPGPDRASGCLGAFQRQFCNYLLLSIINFLYASFLSSTVRTKTTCRKACISRFCRFRICENQANRPRLTFASLRPLLMLLFRRLNKIPNLDYPLPPLIFHFVVRQWRTWKNLFSIFYGIKYIHDLTPIHHPVRGCGVGCMELVRLCLCIFVNPFLYFAVRGNNIFLES